MLRLWLAVFLRGVKVCCAVGFSKGCLLQVVAHSPVACEKIDSTPFFLFFLTIILSKRKSEILIKTLFVTKPLMASQGH